MTLIYSRYNDFYKNIFPHLFFKSVPWSVTPVQRSMSVERQVALLLLLYIDKEEGKWSAMRTDIYQRLDVRDLYGKIVQARRIYMSKPPPTMTIGRMVKLTSSQQSISDLIIGFVCLWVGSGVLPSHSPHFTFHLQLLPCCGLLHLFKRLCIVH